MKKRSGSPSWTSLTRTSGRARTSSGRCPASTLRSVWEPNDVEGVKTFSERYGVTRRRHGGSRSPGHPACDAVVVESFTQNMADITIAAPFDAGKSVLLEKPAANNPAEHEADRRCRPQEQGPPADRLHDAAGIHGRLRARRPERDPARTGHRRTFSRLRSRAGRRHAVVQPQGRHRRRALRGRLPHAGRRPAPDGPSAQGLRVRLEVRRPETEAPSTCTRTPRW